MAFEGRGCEGKRLRLLSPAFLLKGTGFFIAVKIVFVIGGSRSGKSSFALSEAAKLPGPKAFIATAEALDQEMCTRIDAHRAGRGSEWDTIEEPVDIAGALSNIRDRYRVIILDCLTLWLSNILLGSQDTADPKASMDQRIQEFTGALEQHGNSPDSSLYIVSSEVGMSVVPENSLARQFRDLAGSLNQRVAGAADEVYMVTAGIPVKIKG